MYEDIANDSAIVQSMRLADRLARTREDMRDCAVSLANAVLDAAPLDDLTQAYRTAVAEYRRADTIYTETLRGAV